MRRAVCSIFTQFSESLKTFPPSLEQLTPQPSNTIFIQPCGRRTKYEFVPSVLSGCFVLGRVRKVFDHRDKATSESKCHCSNCALPLLPHCLSLWTTLLNPTRMNNIDNPGKVKQETGALAGRLSSRLVRLHSDLAVLRESGKFSFSTFLWLEKF